MSRSCSTTVRRSSFFFFFNDTATTEIYTLSLHDALPICTLGPMHHWLWNQPRRSDRSEEHTSELQSRFDLVCRLLLEKKKKNILIQPFEIKKTIEDKGNRAQLYI